MADAAAALAAWLKLDTPDDRALTAIRSGITAVEQRYDVRLPEDFRHHLMRIGAGEGEIWDDELVLWWPVARLRNLPEEYPQGSANPEVVRDAKRYIFFADYSIWCWAWAIYCQEGAHYGKVMVIGVAGDPVVADSFTDFVEGYLRDPNSVMW